MQNSRVHFVDSIECPYQLERGRSHCILALNPLINDAGWSNVSRVGSEIHRQLLNLNHPALIVDLSRLDYIGSSQLALLVRVWKSLRQIHGRMAVYCPGEMVRDVLNAAGLKSLWAIAETRTAALEAVGVADVPQNARTGLWRSLYRSICSILGFR